jgi:hypothetical protein
MTFDTPCAGDESRSHDRNSAPFLRIPCATTLEGERGEIERGLEWVEQQGVRIDPVYEDIVEG